MKRGAVFLIPTYLSETNDSKFLAPMVLDVVSHTTYFLVENVRTARRFISSLKLGIDISSLTFETVDKKSSSSQMADLMHGVHEGKDVGILSEAGLPGLADPGHLVVNYAHRHNIRVIPLPGASSIQTAVTTSGFNGQQFTFHGYLPIQKAERAKAIKKLEEAVEKTGYTQVFMETPFRNMSLLGDLLQHLKPHSYLHIAADLFGKKEQVKTMPVATWQKSKIDLHKIPAVYCLGNSPDRVDK